MVAQRRAILLCLFPVPAQSPQLGRSQRLVYSDGTCCILHPDQV